MVSRYLRTVKAASGATAALQLAGQSAGVRRDSRQAAILAGGHCIPVALPNIERMIWHKLYSSTQRTHEPEKAEKDLIQAVTLAAIIVEQNGAILRDSFHQAPKALRAATMARVPRIQALLAPHPEARDAFGALSIDR